jgi:hypothetical protein
MITSQITTIDGFCRRWVDVTWTAVPALHKLETSAVKYVYFVALCAIAAFGMATLWIAEKPGNVFKLATNAYNYAFAFSAWHTLAVNLILLPRELRPGWGQRLGLILGGLFFMTLGVLTTLQLLRELS